MSNRTLHGTQGGSVSSNAASTLSGYNSSSANGTPNEWYRSSPVALNRNLNMGMSGVGINGTPSANFSPMQQQLQLAQSQFYSTAKAHQQVSNYSAPSQSFRNRASQSQNILRVAASHVGAGSLGNYPYHQPASPHSSFQSNYSLDSQNQAQGRPSGGQGTNYPGAGVMRESYAPMRSSSIGHLERSSDPYLAERETMFGLNQGVSGGGGVRGVGGGGGRSLSLSSPLGSGSGQASSYGFNSQHPDLLGGAPLMIGSNSISSGLEQRERFIDTSRVGLEAHLGLFSAAQSPISSQQISYDSSMSASYEADARSFPSHSISLTSNRSSASLFSRLETTQTLGTASPQLFQSGQGGIKSKPQPQIDLSNTGPLYGNYLRPGHHEMEQSSPTNTQFTGPTPSPKFDPLKWV